MGPKLATLLVALTACSCGSSTSSSNGVQANVEISADFSVAQGTFAFSTGRYLTSVPDQGAGFGSQTLQHLKLLNLVVGRVWVEFSQAYQLNLMLPNYQFFYPYLDAWSGLATSLLLNWRTDYDSLVTGGGWSEQNLLTAETAMLVNYKTRYPTIQWIECENEPMDIATYYVKYRFVYRMVNAVNSMGLPGPALKVGGPTVNFFDESAIGTFLDSYVADSDPSKRLDFVSYHQYLFGTNTDPYANKDYPAMVSGERAGLDALLTARKLDVQTPAYITETGVFPSDQQSALGFNADLHIQAAALAALQFFYLNQNRLYPFHWTVVHPTNPRKSMFTSEAQGVPLAYYQMQQMETMLPGTRFASTTVLSDRGLGIGSLAGGTSGQVALMTWNYQWVNQKSLDAVLVLKNLPVAFQTRQVLVEYYRIPVNRDSGELLKTDTSVIAPLVGGSYQVSVQYEPNEVDLVVLTAQ